MSTNLCPSPFLDASQYVGDETDGYVEGRLCFPLDGGATGSACCLPCPAVSWIYPPSFRTSYRVASIMNVPGLVLCTILLFALARDRNGERSSKQLNMYLVIGVCSLALGFIVPLAAKPDQCADAITPRDMHSSGACAFSGAFIVLGALSATVWIFMKTVTLHLHICWPWKPNRNYDLAVQVLGWSISIIFTSLTLASTGVSFRFGDTCHVNMKNSTLNFWGPMLVMAGLSTVLQFATLSYCIKSYVDRVLFLPNDSTAAARQSRLREVQHVIRMQWRSILVIFFIVLDVTFFAVLFVYLDERESRILSDPERVLPWVNCMLRNPAAVHQCTGDAEDLFIPEAAVVTALFLLAATGFQCFILVFPLDVKDRWLDASKELWNRCVRMARSFLFHEAERHGEFEHQPRIASGHVVKSMVARISGNGYEQDAGLSSVGTRKSDDCLR